MSQSEGGLLTPPQTGMIDDEMHTGKLSDSSQMSSNKCESPTALVPESGDLGKYVSSVEALTNDEKYQLLTHPFIVLSKLIGWTSNNGLVYSPLLERGLCKY